MISRKASSAETNRVQSITEPSHRRAPLLRIFSYSNTSRAIVKRFKFSIGHDDHD